MGQRGKCDTVPGHGDRGLRLQRGRDPLIRRIIGAGNE